MSKINFTKEHLVKLKELATKMLFAGSTVQGLVGTQMSVHDLIHNATINTLITFNSNMKKEIERISSLDEWSMNDYQQKKLEILKETQEFVNLLIGYKKNQSELEADKSKLRELRAKQAELKESTLTPEDKLKALDEEIAKLSENVEG